MAADLFASTALIGLALAFMGLLAVKARLVPAIGYLLVGVVLAPLAYRGILPAHALEVGTEIGVLVLLFLIGLELDLKRLREALRATVWIMPFDVAVPAAAVAILARLLGWSVTEAIAAGLTVAISSTLFGDQLSRGAKVPPEARRRVLGVLIAEDVAAGVILTILVVMGGTGAGIFGPAVSIARLVLLLILLTAAALLVVPRLLDAVARTHVHELLVLTTGGLILLFGYLGYHAGSAELGALVAGVAAAEAGSRYVVRSSMAGVRDIALAVFFFGSGILVDTVGALQNWVLVLAVAAVFMIAKLAVHIPSAVAAGLGLEGGLRTGVSLATIGEFSLILVAVADKAGLAHPLLATIVVGAMVVALISSGLLMRAVPAIARSYRFLPARLRHTLEWIVYGLRRGSTPSGTQKAETRRASRLLAANLMLLAALALVAVWLARRYMAEVAQIAPFWGPVLFLGAMLGASVPMARSGYRAYRELVWSLVGIRPGERQGAGRVRARLVDAWVATTAFLVFVFVTLRIPQALPVVVGAGFVAIIIATIAWRRLNNFHRTLENTLGRVLGDDPTSGQVLDRIMQAYPWGVRFAAVAVRSDSPVVNRSIRDSRLATLTGVIVAVIQRKQDELVNPGPEIEIRSGDTLILVGDQHQLSRAEALIVAHGEALRLEAQSRSAQLEELEVTSESVWTEASLGSIDVRQQTGVLVLGVLQGEGAHPRPYSPEIRMRPGDRLIVLGTPLQVDRAKRFATGAEGKPGPPTV